MKATAGFVIVVLAVATFTGCNPSRDDSGSVPTFDAYAKERYRMLTEKAKTADWHYLYSLEGSRISQGKLRWARLDSLERIDTLDETRDPVLSGQTFINRKNDGAHCLWVLVNELVDATCYPQRGRSSGGRAVDSFADGLLSRALSQKADAIARPPRTILGVGLDCFGLSGALANGEVCLSNDGSPLFADLTLLRAGDPLRIKISAIASLSEADGRLSVAIIPGAERSDERVRVVRRVDPSTVNLPEFPAIAEQAEGKTSVENQALRR